MMPVIARSTTTFAVIFLSQAPLTDQPVARIPIGYTQTNGLSRIKQAIYRRQKLPQTRLALGLGSIQSP
jgi:hypothetical protein